MYTINYIQVVVTNQITGTVSHDDNKSDSSELDSDFIVTAALGNTWSHCVNTRLLLTPSSKGDKHIVSKMNGIQYMHRRLDVFT